MQIDMTSSSTSRELYLYIFLLTQNFRAVSDLEIDPIDLSQSQHCYISDIFLQLYIVSRNASINIYSHFVLILNTHIFDIWLVFLLYGMLWHNMHLRNPRDFYLLHFFHEDERSVTDRNPMGSEDA